MPDEICDVPGCGKEAIRSISAKVVGDLIPNLPQKKRRYHLCREHYRPLKKKNKENNLYQRLGWE